MPLTFTSRAKRDELAERLVNLANDMRRSFDQGHDGRISVSEEMIEDITCAAAVVALAKITPVEGEREKDGPNTNEGLARPKS